MPEREVGGVDRLVARLFPRHPFLRSLLATLVAAALARQVAWVTLMELQEILVFRRWAYSLFFVPVFAMGWLVIPALGRAARGPRLRESWPPVALAVALVVGAVGARHVALSPMYDSTGRTEERVPGAFPFQGGSVREEDRKGYHMVANILPDGTRHCGGAEGDPTVVLIGDSYVFGVGLRDEQTFCWKIREQLAGLGVSAHVINLGQPGASLHSYPATLRYALDVWHPDMVVLTLLPVNDLQAWDVNDQRDMLHAPLFQLVSDVLAPEPVWTVWTVATERLRPHFLGTWVLRWGLGNVAAIAEEARVPVLTEVFLFAEDARFLKYGAEAIVGGVAAGSSWFRVAEPWYPSRNGEGESRYIPSDFHPTELGNQDRAAQLAPQIAAILRGGAR